MVVMNQQTIEKPMVIQGGTVWGTQKGVEFSTGFLGRICLGCRLEKRPVWDVDHGWFMIPVNGSTIRGEIGKLKGLVMVKLYKVTTKRGRTSTNHE